MNCKVVHEMSVFDALKKKKILWIDFISTAESDSIADMLVMFISVFCAF